MKKYRKSTKNNKSGSKPVLAIGSSFTDDLRQLLFDPEIRIAAPIAQWHTAEAVKPESLPAQVAAPQQPQANPRTSGVSNDLAVEFGTCLWYLKTKFFKKVWDDPETGDDDPRVRRALSRINRSVAALKETGIEVVDPTNMRYPPGGEATMRPIQHLPTPGLTVERVSDTVSPIFYRDERLIQRGEVFVEVPKQEPSFEPKVSAATTPSAVASGTLPDPSATEGKVEVPRPTAEAQADVGEVVREEGSNGDESSATTTSELSPPPIEDGEKLIPHLEQATIAPAAELGPEVTPPIAPSESDSK